MSKETPKYTQREINQLFAKYLLSTETAIPIDLDDRIAIGYIACDDYIYSGIDTHWEEDSHKCEQCRYFKRIQYMAFPYCTLLRKIVLADNDACKSFEDPAHV